MSLCKIVLVGMCISAKGVVNNIRTSKIKICLFAVFQLLDIHHRLCRFKECIIISIGIIATTASTSACKAIQKLLQVVAQIVLLVLVFAI